MGHELRELRKLSPFARALFVELRALANPAGQVATTYAVLIALMDFDGARGDAVPTVQKVRGAIADLIELRLLVTNRSRNGKDRRLFFMLEKVAGTSSAANPRNRSRNRPSHEGKSPDSQQISQQGLLDPEIHRAPVDNSGDPGPVSERQAEARAKLAQLADRMRTTPKPQRRNRPQ
jgi:hypothetical protein